MVVNGVTQSLKTFSGLNTGVAVSTTTKIDELGWEDGGSFDASDQTGTSVLVSSSAVAARELALNIAVVLSSFLLCAILM